MKSPGNGSRRRAGRNFRCAVAALFTGALIASCTSGPDDGGETELTIGLFGDFGYRELYAQYEKEHPGIRIVERVTAFDDHHTSLATHLATGRGANDIEAVETGYIGRFKSEPGKFVNFLDHGVGAQRDWWLPWKWDQSLSTDGKSQIGLGTDVGGLAMCYRTDMFEKAGLPTERDEVSALWPDWNAYFATGDRYTAGAPAGTRFFDGGATVFNAMIGQARTGYYDDDGNLVVKTNPVVRQSWDAVTQAIGKGQSARLTPLTNDWNNGFAESRFATIPCPSWMTAFIQDQAKSSAGKWDVATVPGGSGNWGGSFLTVPEQGDHIDEAVELARWLTAPEQQKAVFKENGNLPSQPALYKDPAITGLVKPFFNDAPVGRIFTESALKLQPQPQGPKSGEVMVAFTNGFNRVEAGTESPDAAWNSVIADIEHGER
ncbi:extracellular solute-binding protein [Streptomyces sp. WAC 01420]|uniref:ABC transporter substrate-binding protein n=1 Tax=Streptomyces sp. WAC 01420 TaxID=2203203 RepID=UPI000F6BE27F|nr:ABC transporter substrate-binding protein [Streptomyces sp. WAC 01420]AZM58465.1 ABC transporter substrate-binding protein [Streptomyces sp. WAC 01438]RSM88975.1 ABC transporter substrate-binding protein [Streptomyces sp. WAC 01420]